MMRLAFVLLSLGLFLVAFGWWGVQTRAGRAAFDEMAGMIPFFAGVLGGVCVVVAAVIAAVVHWRRG